MRFSTLLLSVATVGTTTLAFAIAMFGCDRDDRKIPVGRLSADLGPAPHPAAARSPSPDEWGEGTGASLIPRKGSRCS